jgi:hypothetical protein
MLSLNLWRQNTFKERKSELLGLQEDKSTIIIIRLDSVNLQNLQIAQLSLEFDGKMHYADFCGIAVDLDKDNESVCVEWEHMTRSDLERPQSLVHVDADVNELWKGAPQCV